MLLTSRKISGSSFRYTVRYPGSVDEQEILTRNAVSISVALMEYSPAIMFFSLMYSLIFIRSSTTSAISL